MDVLDLFIWIKENNLKVGYFRKCVDYFKLIKFELYYIIFS